MYSEDYTDLEEYGRPIELHEPYLGYTYGHIVGRIEYKYIIQLSSGLEILAYADEFEFI